jgi:hypothetical protein
MAIVMEWIQWRNAMPQPWLEWVAESPRLAGLGAFLTYPILAIVFPVRSYTIGSRALASFLDEVGSEC